MVAVMIVVTVWTFLEYKIVQLEKERDSIPVILQGRMSYTYRGYEGQGVPEIKGILLRLRIGSRSLNTSLLN